MTLIGVASWIVASLAAFALTRAVARGRRHWGAELGAAIVTGLVTGLAATAMNFGGWQVVEPAAVAFCVLTSATAIGLIRLAH